MLPKKLRNKLFWDSSVHDACNVPTGWGFYIVEGVDWFLASWYTLGIVLASTGLTIAWSTAKNDVQGAIGIGQYCMAVLAVLISTVLLGCGDTLGPPDH